MIRSVPSAADFGYHKPMGLLIHVVALLARHPRRGAVPAPYADPITTYVDHSCADGPADVALYRRDRECFYRS